MRLQTRTADGPKGMLGTFVRIVKSDGVSGLYSGVCLRSVPFLASTVGMAKKLHGKMFVAS